MQHFSSDNVFGFHAVYVKMRDDDVFWKVSAQLNQFVKVVRHTSGFLWLLRLARVVVSSDGEE